jgi:hypothetical protein
MSNNDLSGRKITNLLQIDLRTYEPPGEVRVYSMATGEFLRTEPSTEYHPKFTRPTGRR